MEQVIEIKLTLTNGEDLIFQPKEQSLVKLMRGVEETSNGFISQKSLNGREVLLIVCGPEGVRELFRNSGDIHYWIQEILNG